MINITSKNKYGMMNVFGLWFSRFQILMCEPKIIWCTDFKLSLLYPHTYLLTSVKCYLKSPCSLDKLKPSSAVQESFQVNSRRSKDPLQNEDKKILFLDLTTRFCAGAIRTANQTWWRLVSHVQYVSQIQLKSLINHLLYSCFVV